jgi:cytolysin (calcineurin-like family phosphatase)
MACSNQCALLNRCGVPVTDCVARCSVLPLLHTCFARAQPNCAQVEFCALANLCAPAGTQTCASTISCYTACGNNTACTCTCTQQASPNVAQIVLSRDGCLLACGNNQNCINQQCGQFTANCLRQ